MDKVRYGIIGCGGIARGFHLRDMTAIAEAELIACADITVEKAKAMAAEYKAKAYYEDYHQLLARDDIDAVIVCTWHETHAAIGADVLKAGKHVLVQKPMTISIEDANTLVDAAVEGRKHGLKTYCFPYNWNPAYEKALELIKNGDLGQICQGRCRVAHGGPGRQSWFYNPDIAKVGASFDMGVYSVSAITGLLGPAISAVGLVKSLEPGVRIDDNAIVQLEFASGAIGAAETSWTQQAAQEGTALYGTKGTIYLGWAGHSILVHLNDQRDKGWYTPELPPGMPNAPHRHFVQCILEDLPPKGTPEHGRHVVEILLAEHESEKTGKRVQLKTTFDW